MPITGDGWLGAGMSILGGLFGGGMHSPESSNEQSRGNVFGAAQGAREAGERYGFNPLALLGLGGSSSISGGENHIGNAIADAGAALASAWSPNASNKQKLQQYQSENDALRKRVASQTIRPVVPGLYGQPSGVEVPSVTFSVAGSKLPATGSDLPLTSSQQMDAITSAAPTAEELAIPAGSDSLKAVPKAPIFWDGQWIRPHPDFPDASFTEEYLGDEGPPSWIANTTSGMKKLGYSFAQTPLGMTAKGWLDGSYPAAIRMDAQEKFSRKQYGTDEVGNARDYKVDEKGRAYYIKNGKRVYD